MNVYIWSDHHFYHKNIIKYCNRPFDFTDKGVIENAELMFNNHQKNIKDDDIVIYLGNLVFEKDLDSMKERFQDLKGYKVLFLGNHDVSNYDYNNLGFKKVFKYLIIDKTMFCHYPLIENSVIKENFYYNKCKVLYHGHTHNNPIIVNDNIKRINVCVDYGNNNYMPIEIKGKLKKSLIEYMYHNKKI